MFHLPKQGHLAEILSGSQSRHRSFRSVLLTEYLNLAAENNIEVPGQLSLLEYNGASLIMGPGDSFGPDNVQLYNITVEEQFQGPVKDYPQLALYPGNLG